MSRLRHLVLCTSILSIPAGCATTPNLSTQYAETARENFELAREEFLDKDWESAISYADFVRIRFPFSRFAVDAELLAARARFESGEYVMAQDAFRQFARLHPTHRHVRDGWADYMVIVSSYMAVPDSTWPLPPHYQLDQASLRQSLMDMENFLTRFAGSPMYEYAVDLRATMLRKLLEHELYVAKYYLDRGKPDSAIGRLKLAHEQYPGIGMDAEIQFLLGMTYLRMEEVELARNTFTELENQHAEHYKGKQARIYLDYIYNTYGPPDLNRPRPEREDTRPKRPPRLKAGALGSMDKRNPAVKRERPAGTQSPPKAAPPASSPAQPATKKPAGSSPEPAKPQTATSGQSEENSQTPQKQVPNTSPPEST